MTNHTTGPTTGPTTDPTTDPADGASGLRIRPAGPAAAPALAALHAEVFPEEPWDVGALTALLAGPGTLALLALPDPPPDPGGEALLGFAMLRVAGGEAEILTLAVHPRHRRRGVARRLLDATATAAAVIGGATALFLEVAEDNRAARALYRGAGFRRVGRRRGYYPALPAGPQRAGPQRAGPRDALVLRRALVPRG